MRYLAQIGASGVAAVFHNESRSGVKSINMTKLNIYWKAITYHKPETFCTKWCH